ncbi:hypothetical protein D8I24_5554 [Cupriavidus necator H850]|nr:hypothetical protein D8I24_5554 [Cupriavidus necator H850]
MLLTSGLIDSAYMQKNMMPYPNAVLKTPIIEKISICFIMLVCLTEEDLLIK